jgi:2-dehydro-3-deoxyphosphogluconate aldolase/(4S)-4-hydroxy-2-oxoglutarate aldolase
MNEIDNKFQQIGVIPVIEIENAEAAVSLGKAMGKGGITILEITFRTGAAAKAIEHLTQSCPDILVGAGSVINMDQLQTAVRAGARFIVSPGVSMSVVEWCLANNMPVFPGVSTPTEVISMLTCGLKTLKYFPAEGLGGISYLKAISAPFPEVKFIPTGGISTKNLADYLSKPFVKACGGSWLATREMIGAGEFDRIEKLAREASEIVQMIRPNP